MKGSWEPAVSPPAGARSPARHWCSDVRFQARIRRSVSGRSSEAVEDALDHLAAAPGHPAVGLAQLGRSGAETSRETRLELGLARHPVRPGYDHPSRAGDVAPHEVPPGP